MIVVPIVFLSVCLFAGLALTKAFVPLSEHELGRHHVAWLIISTVIHAAFVALMALEALDGLRRKDGSAADNDG
jgi:hypothetical protein